MDRHNAYLTIQLIRSDARERGYRLDRVTVYRRAQNMLARHADEALAAGMPDDAAGLASAAKYCGAKTFRRVYDAMRCPGGHCPA